MRLLLDTHLLLWVAEGPPDMLSSAGRRLLAEEGNELVFSAASLWEIALKAHAGKADFGVDAGAIRRALLDSGYVELPVTGEHAAATSTLPAIHKDPFDRLLLAQAICEGITLVTADKTLASYPGPVRKV